MGPILLCDKSTLQGLSRAELNMLRKNYSLNIPPVLLMEILADLRKTDNIEAAQEEVQQLANKLVPACSYVNVGFRDVVIGELHGYKAAADGRPILRGGKSVRSGDQTGMIFEQAPEEEALLRWQCGSFLDAEKILATEWRRVSQGIDLESMQRALRSHYSDSIRVATFAQVMALVDQILASAAPRELISWFLKDSELVPEQFDDLLDELEAFGAVIWQRDLPYTRRCIRIGLIFHFALAFGLISTRSTNRIDLEYLYYLPCCMVFSSGDGLHRNLAPLVSVDQIFIPRDVFKADLKGLVMWWTNLTPDEQETERQISGPPEFEASPTYQAWKKFMKPDYRQRAISGQRMPPEAGPKSMEDIRKIMRDAVPDESSDRSIDECDFVVRKQHVRLDGPCICGSDRIFRNCCGQEIVTRLGH